MRPNYKDTFMEQAKLTMTASLTNYGNLDQISATAESTQTQAQSRKSQIDPETERKIVDWVKQQYNFMREARQPIEVDWYLNIAYYMGKQYVEPQPRGSAINTVLGGRLFMPGAPPWRVRLTVNSCLLYT